MVFTTPRTWVTNELVTAAMLNEQIRDNLSYLLTPASFFITSSATLTTTSSSYANVTGLVSSSITTYGGHFLMGISGFVNATTGQVDIAMAHDGANEIVVHRSNSSVYFAGVALKASLAAGAHTFSARWRQSGGGTATMRGADNAGVAYGQIVFWGLEI